MKTVEAAKETAHEIINDATGFLLIAVKPDGLSHIITAISSQAHDEGVINGIMTFMEYRDREHKKRIDQHIPPDITVH
jgi:hypothetical protein